MAVFLGVWTMVISIFLLLSALPIHGRGDTFYIEHAQGSDWDEARDPPDDILYINQELIFPGAPESSFLIEGDIIKASPFRLFPSANPRWPKKRGIVQIPYVISYKYDESSVKILKGAFEDFSKFTCIQFVPYSNQRDFIAIAPLSGCFSSVGRIGGMQVVSLAPACLRKGKGVALHELMHVVGFWHEHSRADRDKYISISWDEILTGFEINFMKSWNTNMLVDYDYSSVMHYGRNAFSMSGSPTIIPLSSSLTFLGQRWNLSNSDVARVNKLYKCSQVAAQPETSTKGVIKENVMDFIPSGYLSLMPLAHISSQKAVLVSPPVQGIRCLKFWYNPGDLLMSEINIYIMLRNSSEWHKMWSVRGNQGTGWHLVAVAISKTCELQVVLEGVTGPKGRHSAGIDDLLLCRKPCGQCYSNMTRSLCNK